MGTTTDASGLFSTCARQKWALRCEPCQKYPGVVGNMRLAPIGEGGHETAAAIE